jgi:hypothetical protein
VGEINPLRSSQIGAYLSFMSFGKPFQAKSVKLGPYWRAEQRRERRKRALRFAGMLATLSLGVFVLGMVLTNWTALRAMLPTYPMR